MENLLKQFAAIFDYYSFPNIQTSHSYYVSTWNKIDQNIKRLYSLSKVLDSTLEVNKPNFNKNFFDFTGKPLIECIDKQRDKCLYVKDDLYETLIEDVLQVQFQEFYTHIILGLYHENMLDTDRKLNHMFLVIHNLPKIKEMCGDSFGLNLYKNFLFGQLLDEDRRRVTNISDKIQTQLTSIKGFLKSDTDKFFFKNHTSLESDLEYSLSLLKIPYSIRKIDKLIMFPKKKSVIQFDSGELKIDFPSMNQSQYKAIGL